MVKLNVLVYFICFVGCVVLLQGYVLPQDYIQSSSDIVTYFKSPEELSSKHTMRINVNQPTVTQIRVDFKTFNLSQSNGSNIMSAPDCLKDKFKVISSTGVDLLGFKHLCGENSGQHIYVFVDASERPTYVDLIFEIDDTEAAPTSNWELEVTQVDCTAKPTKDLCAPPGCLQFYKERQGQFQSFNYNQGSGPYQGSLNYAICFKNIENMCKITYKADTFTLPYDDATNPYGQNGCNQDTTDPNNPFSKDYLFIPNAEVGKVKDSLFCGNYLKDKEALVTIQGPKLVVFHSDEVMNYQSNGEEQGFSIKYEQTSC